MSRLPLQWATKAAEFASAHHQFAREVLSRQTALQFSDTDPGHAARLAELATLVEGPRAELAARWAGAHGDGDGDALLAVAEELQAMGDPIAAADATAQAALCFTRGERHGPALAAASRAARIAADCGAVTPATQAANRPLQLSPREYDIAVLVADGLTNRQIAETLTLSPRTVEGHIFRIRTRLGLPNRGELAQVIAEATGRRSAPT